MKSIQHKATWHIALVLLITQLITSCTVIHAAQKQQTARTRFSADIADARASMNKPNAQIDEETREETLNVIDAVANAIYKDGTSFPSSTVVANTAKHIQSLVKLLRQIKNNNPTEQQEQQLLTLSASLNRDSEEMAQVWRKADAKNMFAELKPLLNVVITKATQPAEVFGEGKDVFDPRYAKPSKLLSQPTVFTSERDKPVTPIKPAQPTAAPKPAIPAKPGAPTKPAAPATPTKQIRTPLGTFTGTSTVQEAPERPATAPRGGYGTTKPAAPVGPRPGEVAITPTLLAEYKTKTGITMTEQELRKYLSMKPEEQEIYVTLADNERKQFLTMTPAEKKSMVKKKFELKLGVPLSERQLSEYLALAPQERVQHAIQLRRESAAQAQKAAASMPAPSAQQPTIKQTIITTYASIFGEIKDVFSLTGKDVTKLTSEQLPAWNRTIHNAQDYIKKQAGGDSRLITALNNCMKINDLITQILTAFYGPDRDMAVITRLIGKPTEKSNVHSLMGLRKNITEQATNPASQKDRAREQAFPKLMQLKFGASAADKAKAEARDTLIALGQILLTIIDKIERGFEALPKAQS